MAYPMLIFSHTRNPNHFSWNTIIRGFAISHYPLGSIPVFNRMRWLRVQPESFTYAFLIKACARSRALKIGGSVHCVVLVSGYASDLYVVSTLVGFYAVCGDMGGAGKVFDEMPERNVVAWNALLCGYVRNGRGRDGLGVFERMWREGFRPDEVTMVGVVSACAQGREIELGRWAHGYIRGNGEGLELSVNVATALIDMYAKCNQMEAAVCVFEKLGAVDVGAWNALIGGYVLNGCFREAIDLFQKLEANGIDPDETTLVSTLRACAYIGALDVGRKIHLLARERCFELNLTLGTALVDMYSKCGCIKDARVIFNKMSKRDVMTWTSMICGLAVHGYAKDALNLFLSMLGSGLKPDGVTFVGVLCACSHAGLVDQGIYYFESMRDEFGINPTIEHYGCVIDLLGRAGRLQETLKLVYSMEIQPNQIIWRTFLGACKLYLNAELAETAVENLIRLHSDNCGDYVLLANIYASKGMWENVEKIRRKLEGKGLHKFPGLSFIKEA
ncbi:hypothetical protein Sjap_018720 [Stephania japonica]|uniref:Pentatricopeptide repeat-containing protein n=1 Tax=Stephania japonica TaxID=461633 RepID=A0AAP0I8L8_9MAGN